ncbi:hypothetical protein KY348_04830 [Candidatus Woesearchaeota archaeon]|nr:hypothetical protein [Candidatus Woesearchaeota archaeon]
MTNKSTNDNLKEKKKGMKTLCSILIAGTIGLNIACSRNPVKQVEYPPPKAIKYSAVSERIMSLEELFQTAMHNVEKSTLLSPEVISEIPNLEYFITTKKEEYAALYYREIPRILLVMPKTKDVSEQVEKERNLRLTIVHELGHHYFVTEISEQEQKDFRKEVKEYNHNYEQLQKHLDWYPKLTDEVLDEYSFTKHTHEAFKKFKSIQDYFKKRYGKHWFEHKFYGTEAFAVLAEKEFLHELVAQIVLNPENGYLLDEKEKERKIAEIKQFNHIPEQLIEFYKGFFNKK